jgi:hypothetical protein
VAVDNNRSAVADNNVHGDAHDDAHTHAPSSHDRHHRPTMYLNKQLNIPLIELKNLFFSFVFSLVK